MAAFRGFSFQSGRSGGLGTADRCERLFQLTRRGLGLAVGSEHLAIRRMVDRHLLHDGKRLSLRPVMRRRLA